MPQAKSKKPGGSKTRGQRSAFEREREQLQKRIDELRPKLVGCAEATRDRGLQGVLLNARRILIAASRLLGKKGRRGAPRKWDPGSVVEDARKVWTMDRSKNLDSSNNCDQLKRPSQMKLAELLQKRFKRKYGRVSVHTLRKHIPVQRIAETMGWQGAVAHLARVDNSPRPPKPSKTRPDHN
jgi:hypothetical protein